MISPKLALFLNFITTTLSAVLALGSAVFSHVGFPEPEKIFSCGLLFQAVLNGFLHSFSSTDAGPLVHEHERENHNG